MLEKAFAETKKYKTVIKPFCPFYCCPFSTIFELILNGFKETGEYSSLKNDFLKGHFSIGIF